MPPERATRTAWKTEPMPETHVSIAYARTFDRDELARVTLGLVPREMEDKWFVFCG